MENQIQESPLMKKCSKCGLEKPLEDFNSNISNKDGKHIWCKSCLKQYRSMNKENIAKARERYMNNGGREKVAEHYFKNRENILINRKNKPKPDDEERRKRAAKRAKIRYYLNREEILKRRVAEYHNNYEKSLWMKAKTRAKRKKIYFNIEVSDISIPEICPILGILIVKDNSKTSPNSPSLDRIDNTKGYVKGNVMVISHAANSLKKDFTINILERMLSYMKNNLQNISPIQNDNYTLTPIVNSAIP